MALERILLGRVPVDSGQLLVVDPCYIQELPQDDYDRCCEASNEHGGPVALGTIPDLAVCFPSGFGDGEYEVWAEVKKFGNWGRRVTRVEILLVDED